jgi:hypothetical protein
VATIDDGEDFELVAGAIAIVKFTNSNSASNCTLNVGGTGAKSIWYGTSVFTGSNTNVCGYANRSNMYVYDGTYWVWMSYSQYDTDTNTTYTPQSLGNGYCIAGRDTSVTTKVVYSGELAGYTLKVGGIVSVAFVEDVTGNPSYLNINGQGTKPILYRSSSSVSECIYNGDTATFIYDGSYYHLISVDRGNALVIALAGEEEAYTYNGSKDVEIAITPGNIGAAASSHSHQTATTSSAGFMSASDKSTLNTLNSNLLMLETLTVSSSVTANTSANITLSWSNTPKAAFVFKVVGTIDTTNINFCELTTSTNLRVRSSVAQTVTVTVCNLY